MQLRSIWDLRKQGRVPLLQGPQKLQGQPQMPLINHSLIIIPQILIDFGPIKPNKKIY